MNEWLQLGSRRDLCEEKSTQARNAYLLQLASANAHQNRYFHVDLQNVVKVRNNNSLFFLSLSPLLRTSSSFVHGYNVVSSRSAHTLSVRSNQRQHSTGLDRQIEFSSKNFSFLFSCLLFRIIIDSRRRNVRESSRVLFHPEPDGTLHLLRFSVLFWKDQRTSHDGIWSKSISAGQYKYLTIFFFQFQKDQSRLRFGLFCQRLPHSQSAYHLRLRALRQRHRRHGTRYLTPCRYFCAKYVKSWTTDDVVLQ